MKKRTIYEELGVSPSKEEVHKALENQEKGLYPGAFCKVLPDISGDTDYCSIFHSDSAGTKANLAYMMYKETGDLSFFKGIVQDAIIMNVDDVLCVGVSGNVLISDTISRNKRLINGEILAVLIHEHISFCKWLTALGFPIHLAGGETEDVGDLCRTLEVGVSLFSRIKRSQIIDANNVQEGDIIVGLASSGKASYETRYNSGISSNGLTLARHGTLHHQYYTKYPECYDNGIDEKLIFYGKHLLSEPLSGTDLSVGEGLLSPTRTYSPVIVEIFQHFKTKIHGIYHNTGGGQTKCLNFGNNLCYIKNDLFEIPPIFRLIQASSGASWEEMYQVFNMGHRMEIIISEELSQDIINISERFNIPAKIIGYIEKSPDSDRKNHLLLDTTEGKFQFSKILGKIV
ncbi:MAG: phosphoribosylformylglycinamidine cyclo-ligase [Candidatus Lokiarchaeota archaeon]|nr:phosphoribosylformylglycinamidine cyclo-ligase [Candidatus Lokiarchaeota archaeon]